MKKIVFGVVGILVILSGGFYFWSADKYTVPIMMYHNIEPIDERRANWVSPQTFERHMAFLRRKNYNVIRFDELVNAIKSGKALPRNTVVVTLDDGLRNNYIYGLKTLKKYKIPAIIFMPSDRIGQIDKHLTLNEIKEFMAAGIDFGSHTKDHIYLPPEDLPTKIDEIQNSKKDLEKILRREIRYFAYPLGGFNDKIKELVKEAGYKGACTTNRGYDRFNKDIYELNRIRFSNKDDKDFILWAKLSGYYNLFRELKNPY